MGGAGAARVGPLIAPGGLGAGRLGTSPLRSLGIFEFTGGNGAAVLGTGGGALGFSKLLSVFEGNRGLAGGLIIGVIC